MGKPDIHFSISHSANQVVCALSDQPVGVDIEAIRPGRNVQAMAQLVFHPRELAHMENLAVAKLERYFIQMWSIKEAWVKRAGTGLDLESMRSLFAKHCDEKAEAATLMCMDGTLQQVVAVVSGQAQTLRMTDGWGTPAMWHVSAGN